MGCVWCDKELRPEEVKRGNLCPDCNQVSTGIPGLDKEELNKLPFGVIELNRNGEIIAFNQAEASLSRRAQTEAIGKNFFSEIAPCSNVKEFHGRFEEFLDSDNLSERFDYAYYFGADVVNVQITFLRVNKQLALVLSRRTER
jgi:photoactive yellow protein